MSSPFLSEIKIFAGNFAPVGWAQCNGQLMAISQNTALFSLLGTTYGGDGKTNFALPDLQGRVPMNFGQGPGLTDVFIGEQGGVESVTLLQTEIPAHGHSLRGLGETATEPDGVGALLAATPDSKAYGSGSTVAMADGSVAPVGGSQPHNNMQPYLTLNFVIALSGIFPSRS